MAFDLGDPVSLQYKNYDSAGALADATLVQVTVTDPAGTATTYTVTSTTTGVYDKTLTPASAGRYLVRWVATGTNPGAYTDAFDVDDPADLGLVSLADVKRYLNITSTSSDAELRDFILWATDIAERLTSRQMRRKSFTEVYSVNGGYFTLRQQPVVSVTTVVEDGVTLVANTDYVLDSALGVLYRGSSLSPLYWHAGQDNVSVTYVAGEVNPSPTARLLVLETCRHLWRTQRGASPMGMGGQDEFIPGGNNIVTYRMKELAELLTIPTVA